MNINIRALSEAIEKLPRPVAAGEVLKIHVNDLPKSEGYSLCIHGNINPKDETCALVTLVAKTYCRSQHDCWLEWVLEI